MTRSLTIPAAAHTSTPQARSASRAHHPRRFTARQLLWLLLAALVVLYAFPFAYLLLTSFKPPSDAIAVPPSVLPQRWSTDGIPFRRCAHFLSK